MNEIIRVNGEEVVGKFSVNKSVDYSKTPPRIVLDGILSCERYFEEIDTIESDNLIIDGVNVYSESFGSQDKNIVYNFKAEEIEVKEDIE